MHYQFALVSALAMGLFYIMDIVFAGLKVYTRSAHAMIVSAIVPLLTVPMFIFTFVDTIRLLRGMYIGTWCRCCPLALHAWQVLS